MKLWELMLEEILRVKLPPKTPRRTNPRATKRYTARYRPKRPEEGSRPRATAILAPLKA